MEPGVRKGKRSLLACHTRCKWSMETTHNSVKVIHVVGIKVMKDDFLGAVFIYWTWEQHMHM